jgi:hypothetical protein
MAMCFRFGMPYHVIILNKNLSSVRTHDKFCSSVFLFKLRSDDGTSVVVIMTRYATITIRNGLHTVNITTALLSGGPVSMNINCSKEMGEDKRQTRPKVS